MDAGAERDRGPADAVPGWWRGARRPADRQDYGVVVAFATGWTIGLLAWWSLVHDQTWMVPPNQAYPDGDLLAWWIGAAAAFLLGGAIAAVAYIRVARGTWPWPVGPRRGEPNMTWPWRGAIGAAMVPCLAIARGVWPVRTYDNSPSPTVVIHDSPFALVIGPLVGIALVTVLSYIGLRRGVRTAVEPG
jgi:hypothetical protein